MTKVIEKNTTIPTKASQTFSTAENNQLAVTVHVLQGEREVASGNKSLGRFDLSDIPPAPRGTPQIEVSFDIDSNGILNVSAKDKATDKEQSIVIKASSGLSDEDVERMVKDAELHAEEDRKITELVGARNQAEGMVNSVNKSLEEFGDKVTEEEKTGIDNAVKDLESVLKDDDKGTIEEKTTALTELFGKLSQRMYEENKEEPIKEEDSVVDAEFEEEVEKK